MTMINARSDTPAKKPAIRDAFVSESVDSIIAFGALISPLRNELPLIRSDLLEGLPARTRDRFCGFRRKRRTEDHNLFFAIIIAGRRVQNECLRILPYHGSGRNVSTFRFDWRLICLEVSAPDQRSHQGRQYHHRRHVVHKPPQLLSEHCCVMNL